jgi:hypothetical protein
MARITYQYRGTKAIPTKWFEGIAIEHQYVECWYDGSEEVDEAQVKTRVEELSVIVNDYGRKKYRNIRVN